ncbi:uncharacterized protein LOC132203811 [Neocloeon triangulifer]|uniref:uncharacterized protein LOC132198268 n=1 Tax=Neocloeon triangulifer TaxID=2078957 RepID=UPI00286F93A0|nr:uncharacterized protein LOC132198268 [Neocloeon triangulifer]XP_059478334.1 uncharacterized protein LOC132198361 [Neocloeon triangulifer]XP_059484075.1 uncharacterized protein LOC132201712 [Neocloeon triangulifer]XP_059487867.1 uncharacterized protein LOC132203811 [Neocloeon triangulifer]
MEDIWSNFIHRLLQFKVCKKFLSIEGAKIALLFDCRHQCAYETCTMNFVCVNSVLAELLLICKFDSSDKGVPNDREISLAVLLSELLLQASILETDKFFQYLCILNGVKDFSSHNQHQELHENYEPPGNECATVAVTHNQKTFHFERNERNFRRQLFPSSFDENYFECRLSPEPTNKEAEVTLQEGEETSMEDEKFQNNVDTSAANSEGTILQELANKENEMTLKENEETNIEELQLENARTSAEDSNCSNKVVTSTGLAEIENIRKKRTVFTRAVAHEVDIHDQNASNCLDEESIESDALTDVESDCDECELDFLIGVEESDLPKQQPQRHVLSYSLKKEIVAHWQYEDKCAEEKYGPRRGTTRKLSSMQKKYPNAKLCIRKLYQWRTDINEGVMLKSHIKDIESDVYAKFLEFRGDLKIIKGRHLRQWAIESATLKHGLSTKDFCASPTWLENFKRRFKVGGRKINKYVTRKSVREKDDILKSATDFVENEKGEVIRVGRACFGNLDHVGINREMHSARTLAIIGERTIEKCIQSSNSMTHSWTLVPACDASGRLWEPAYLILKEDGGKFGVRVQETVLRPENLFVTCSSSGKMLGSQVEELFTNCIFPNVKGKTARFLIDHWCGWKKKVNELCKIAKEKFGLNVTIGLIPEGTTGKIQPLDVNVNGPFKKLLRTIEDEILMHSIPFPIQTRNNGIKLISFTYHQLCSPRFESMITYAFFKPGYISERGPKYLTPVQYCFALSTKTTCEIPLCQSKKFIVCAWCTSNLCFQHSIECLHMCDNYLP